MFVAFLNPQANFDPNDSYWAEHPDFGGQLVYVKEVALAMGRMGHRVDILTRQIKDPDWPEFADPFDAYPGNDQVRIVRLPCGPEHFLPKEELWPHLVRDWVPKVIEFYEKEGKFPHAMTAHYGDGGLAGVLIREAKGIPFTFTAHSLGAQKMDKLGAKRANLAELDARYHFARRIMAERLSMSHSLANITSTTQERLSQYTHSAYRGAVDPYDDKRFAVIPPGVALDIFDRSVVSPREEEVRAEIRAKLRRDLGEERDQLPAIVASSRLDPKKNHIALVRAFAQSEMLNRSYALVIVTRGLDNPLTDYHLASPTERAVLDEIMAEVARHDLHGRIAIFSLDSQEELAICYRMLAGRCSVFALTARYEPFGLAPLEAMAAGLPVVVTKFGGPAESLREDDRDFGVLVDATDPHDIATGIFEAVGDPERWQRYSEAGYERVLDRYTWNRTAEGYVQTLEEAIVNRDHVHDRLPIHPYFRDPTPENDVTLDELADCYLALDLLAIGETVVDFKSRGVTTSLREAEHFARNLGGQPANFAVYMAKLGCRSAVISRVGSGHFGEFLRQELEHYGVSTEYLYRTPGENTTLVFVSRTPAVPDFSVNRGADGKLSPKDILTEAIDRARIVHASAFALSREPSRSAVRRAFRLAREMGKIVTFDPNFSPRIWPDREEAWEVMAQIMRDVDVVKPSEEDAQRMLDVNLSGAELEAAVLERFHDLGARTVVFTCSGGPVAISEDGKVQHVTRLPEVQVVDRTGAGDAFWAGLMAAHLDGKPWPLCVRFGHEVARYALRTVGHPHGLISKEEIYRRLELREGT